MKDIWKNHKILILIVGYGLVLVGVANFLAVPLIFKIKNTSNEIQKKIIDQEIEQSRVSQLPEMSDNWNNIQLKKEVLEVILNKESEVGFIENIDSIAGRTGNKIDLKIGSNANMKDLMKIKKANAKSENAEKGILDEIGYLNFFPIQINIRGDYNGLVNFIRLLENSHFYVNIISIDLKKQIDDSINANSDGSSNKDKKPEAGEEEKNIKEIIVTDINAIVYTKK